MSKIKAIVINPKDNVGVALVDLKSGSELELKVNTRVVHIKLVEAIPFQHKFSIAHIAQGSSIIKLGEIIGVATQDISPGQHVHIHNVKEPIIK